MKITLASVITLFRIFLTPFIIYFLIHDATNYAWILFCVAILTDVLDGFIARRMNQQSRFGQLLDPIADKILFGSVLCGLALSSFVNSYIFCALWFLLAKELILIIGAMWLLMKKNFFIVPSFLSRLVSFCEMSLIMVLLLQKIAQVYMPMIILYGILIINIVLSICLLLRYLKIVIRISETP